MNTPTDGARMNAPSNTAWPPRAHRRRVRIATCPVPRWYPGKGSAWECPNPGVFYSSRIRASLAWWKGEHAPRAILSALKSGVKLDFHRTPQPFKTSPLLVADKDVAFAVADLAKGDSLGAYQALLPNGKDFLSRTRVDTRPGSSKQRVVHNYRRINDYAKKRTCRYENVKDLPQLLRPGDYMLSFDVSGAFWHIPLHPSTAHYLSFHFALPEFVRLDDGTQTAVPLQLGAYWVDLPPLALGGRQRRYQVIERSCLSIPFGFTNSPFIWTKVMKVIGQCLRRHGIRTLLFIDDVLCALPSKADAFRARDFIEQMFVRSGLTRAPDKGVWIPTRHLPDHLGFDIDTSGLRGQLRVPERRCRDVRMLAKDLLCRAARNTRKVSTDMLRSFTGKVSSVVAACSQARFRSRSLFDVCEEWNPTSTLDRQALRDLQWWVDFHFCSKANGVPLWSSLPTKAIFTDASSTLGYGCVLADDTTSIPLEARRAFGGYWTADQIPWHITMKELVAVRLGLNMYSSELRGHTVRLWEDNQAVVFIIRNRTSRSSLLMAELRLLLQLLDDLSVTLVPRYIRSELNPADQFSRLTDRDAWRLRPCTQRKLLDKVRYELKKEITLDAFACHQTKVVARYASRLDEPTALALDGLALDWRQEVVWLNPPWALLPAIIDKLDRERPAALLIIPHWPTAVWWPSMLALNGLMLPLPLPKFSVVAMHNRVVEPFLNGALELCAVVLKPGMPPSSGQP